MNMAKKNVLILGANGLVGSSCVRVLQVDEKYNTISAKREDADLFNFKATKNLITETKPNVLINAAAKVGGILANNSNRVDFILENLKINNNVLESCIENSSIKIINLGSSCIYPLNAKNPIKESEIMNGKLEPTNSPYAMAKLSAIELGKAISKEYGHSIINLMPTNLYGPNDNFSAEGSHVIPGLIRRMHDAKIKNDKSFNLWGSGKPLREFLYVDDLAKFIKLIIDNEVDDELVNVGSGNEIEIIELANSIKKIINYKGDIKLDLSMPDGNPRKLLDSTIAKNHGWKPEVSLQEGLSKTYDWFLNNY